MGPDILQEVPSQEIPNILKILKTYFPKNITFQQSMAIMEEHKQSVYKFNQKLYRYGHVENGVYVLETVLFVETLLSGINYQVYTTSADHSDLVKVLTETSRISLKPGFGFEAISTRFKGAVCEALATKHVNVHISEFEFFWLPMVEVDLGFVSPMLAGLKATLPEDIYVKYLDESHAAEKDKIWPYSRPGSEQYLANEIKNNFGLGLFNKSNGKMLSSALSCHYGGICVLQTDPDHRSKGYATIIIKSMIKELRNRNQIPFATIDKNNITSLRLFKTNGFERFDEVFWVTKLD